MLCSRIGHGLGDYVSLGDMAIPVRNVDGLWEACDTTNDSWSYAWYDQNWKDARTILTRLIGSVGWQASYAISDHFQPYARLTVDREFEDAAEEAWAQLQSMPNTAPYAVPGAEFDQDYSTLTLGARTKVFGFDANVGTSLTVGHKDANHATVFVTVGAGF